MSIRIRQNRRSTAMGSRRGARTRLALEFLESRELLSILTVTNTADSAAQAGSLRNAITNAANGDTIRFKIPTSDPGYDASTGSWTIRSTAALPVNASISIDGTSQPGFTEGSHPVIQLNGANARSDNGLELNADGCTVKGLVINYFGRAAGIRVNSDGNTIQGNYIGTDVTGTNPASNLYGIYLVGASNLIGTNGQDGGSDQYERNLISNNQLHGVALFSGATHNVVAGNWIELNTNGVYAFGATNNWIGVNTVYGPKSADQRNVISSNRNVGVFILDAGSTGNVVAGNFVGVDPSGTAPRGNTQAGIRIDKGASANVIGGLTVTERNVVSGNGNGGVVVTGGATKNVVRGNYIGLGATGSAISNGSDGVTIIDSSLGNTVGGTASGAGNVIAYNIGNGVTIGSSLTDASLGNAILGNTISANAKLGIDLGNNGVTLNHNGGIIAGKPNGLQNFPVLTSAVFYLGASGTGGTTIVDGTLRADPNSTYLVQLFSNTSPDPSGHGEGQRLLGTIPVSTNASGNATFEAGVFTTTSLVGVALSATATDSAGNSSEFSLNLAATQGPDQTVIVVDVGPTEDQTLYNLQSVVSALQKGGLSGGTPAVLMKPDTSAEVENVAWAISSLAPAQGSFTTVTVIADLGNKSYNAGMDLDVPTGVSAVVRNGTLKGSSPTVNVGGGDVLLLNLTLTNSSAAPTVQVDDGSVTIRKTTIQESTAYPEPGIWIAGGQVDLGTDLDPGDNVINVNGTGGFFLNTSGDDVPMIGVTFKVNGTKVTAPEFADVGVVVTPSSSIFGQSVTLKATVSSPVPGDPVPTGKVTFFDTVTSKTLATVNLTNGVATFTTSALGVGTNTVNVFYGGNSHYRLSVGQSVNDVDAASTTTTLTATPNPSVYGQGVTLKAAVAVVSPGVGTPKGTVKFFDGNKDLGDGTISSGVATLVVTSLGVGTHSITAKYLGDGSFATSTSAALSQVVNKAPTTAVVGSSSPTSVFGQSITLTVVVSAASPGGAVPTGKVTFMDGASSLGTATLSGGSASLTTSALAVGSHAITASYGGDANFTSTVSKSFTQTVNKASSTAAVTSSATPSVFGESVSFTVTVAAVAPGAGTPSGSVQFQIDGKNFGSAVELVDGTATSDSISSLSVRKHTITASYTGDANFKPSKSPSFSQTVQKASTSTIVTANANPSVFGQSVTFTATISVPAPGSGTPAGSVTFKDGSKTLGSATLAGGVATFTTSKLSVATHSITAVYAGNASFSGSTSASLSQEVDQSPTSTSVTTSLSPSVFGQSVSFTATVTAASPGSGKPGGTVTFYDGPNELGTRTLSSNGIATLATTAIFPGSHTITATYSGNGNFLTSSGSVGQVVNRAGSKTIVATSRNPSTFGQSVTFTATVTAQSPGSGIPAGSVRFYDGATFLGTGLLDSKGKAAFSISSLGAGDHSVTATYQGDTSFLASTSSALHQKVNQASTRITLKSTANPSTFGQKVTFTATMAVSSPGSGTPTGIVTFYDGANVLGTGTLVSGAAIFSTTSLSVGTHSIKAVYGGSSDFKTSTSATLSQKVNSAPATLTAAYSLNGAVDEAISIMDDDISSEIALTDLAISQASGSTGRTGRKSSV